MRTFFFILLPVMSFLKIKLSVFKFLPALSIFLSLNCFSQNDSITQVTKVSKVTFFNPGISYEGKIAKYQTLYGQLFMNTSVAVTSSNTISTPTTFYFDPAITIQYRYYYNLKKRAFANKMVERNSANYLGAVFEGMLSKANIVLSSHHEEKRRPVYSYGVVWGLQRNYKKRFSLDINFGAGYQSGSQTSKNVIADNTIKEHVGKFTVLGQLNIGIWLNKKTIKKTSQ